MRDLSQRLKTAMIALLLSVLPFVPQAWSNATTECGWTCYSPEGLHRPPALVAALDYLSNAWWTSGLVVIAGLLAAAAALSGQVLRLAACSVAVAVLVLVVAAGISGAKYSYFPSPWLWVIAVAGGCCCAALFSLRSHLS